GFLTPARTLMIISGLTFSVPSFLWTLDHYFHDWLPPYCTTCPPSIAAIRALWFAPPLQWVTGKLVPISSS
ncbi:hypothetical protein ATANTOWER_006006, partial [Ataeniobius toweri]|nr:hypothetical protein [Ataeniobius toweri]